MYLLLVPALAVFAAGAVWRLLLRRTGWKPPLRILVAALAGILAAVLLYWGMLVLAIYAWQWSDPVTW